MGDLSNEPSMEEILSSIKRIIAEEGDAAPRIRRAGRPAPASEPASDEVLELSDPMPTERGAGEVMPAERIRPERPAGSRAASAARVEREAPDPAPAAVAENRRETPRASTPALDAGVSQGTVDATRGALDHLSRMMVRPDAGSDGSLEGLVREMLRPMLREWLDAQLPGLVQEMVAREIGRITGSRA